MPSGSSEVDPTTTNGGPQSPSVEQPPVFPNPGTHGESDRALAGLIRSFRVRGFVKNLGRLIDRQVGDGSAPCVYACSISAPDLSKIEVDKFPGLLSCHAVEGGGGRYRAYSYWSNSECLDLYGGRLASLLPGAVETLKGHVSYSKVRSRTFWETFPFGTIVITISGVIGAAAALWEYGARLVEPPDITVAFKRDNRFNFQAADVPVVSFFVTNQDRFAPAAVRIRAEIARKDDPPSKTMKERSRLSNIEPGKSNEFDIEGTALEVVSNPGPPEPFELRMVIAAKAGFWRAEREFLFSSPTFRHWQSMGWSKPDFTTASNACYLKGKLYSGRAGKAKAYVVVSMATRVDSVITTVSGPDLPASNEFASEPSFSGEVRTQDFVTGDLRPYENYDYTVKVSSKGASAEACSKLAQAPDIISFR